MLGVLEKSLWFSVLLLAGLLLLTFTLAFGFSGRLPELKPVSGPDDAAAEIPHGPVPDLFATSAVPSVLVASNVINPFFTLHFQPPPPAPTKQVPLHYVGCVESSTGLQRAYVRVGDALAVLPPGEKVIADHAIQQITLKALVLTNAAGQTNVFEFNVTKPIEVPAQ